MSQIPEPVASVAIITYNQVDLVEATIRSVLAQKTDFPFEIVVGDDASTDGTGELLEKLAEEAPNLRVIRHPKNLGLVGNIHAVFDACRGRYVAILGGDDLWIDPNKLAAQVAALRPEDVGLCYTDCDLLEHETGVVTKRKFKVRNGDIFKRLLTGGNFIFACTACFDTKYLTKTDREKLRRYRYEDHPMWLTITRRAKAVGLPMIGARYRIIGGTISRPRSLEKRIAYIDACRDDACRFCRENDLKKYIPKIVVRHAVDVTKLLAAEGPPGAAAAFVKKVPWSLVLRSFRLLKLRLRHR